MKIIFFNIWNGRVSEELLKFIVKESISTDVFCFQESGKKIVSQIKKNIPDFKGYFFTKKYIEPWFFEQAIFVRKGIGVENVIDDFLSVGVGMSIDVNYKNKKVNICNVHGVAFPGDKLDTEDRLSQQTQILKFVSQKETPTIIGGDFNLMPYTKSVSMIEEAGFVNLIKKFDIKKTRNKLTWDFFKHKEGYVKQYFADYCFVSPEIKVKSFEVPYMEVSDHLPLILEFDL